ncbi:efflux RND transporter permease subunit [candidate division FCPU426 bacterium]|nr:efflux RND transporter permease subunit [candidate division FCPU426 bacterium]
MGFIRFFASKSIFVNLMVVFVMVVGLFTFMTAAKEVFPQIKFGYIAAWIVYPQAGSSEVEKLITIPIENAIEDVDGIKRITSWSSEGLSMIGIELLPNVKDVKSVLDDVEAEIDALQDLPENAEDPEILEISTDVFPLINISVSGGKDYSQLRDAAGFLEDKLEKVKGVGEIIKNGYYDRAIWVDADKRKLNQYGLTLFNFINVLQDRDISMPAGNKVFGKLEKAVRLSLPLEDAEDVRNVIIRSNDLGNNVRVRDVAEVTNGFKDEEMYMRSQGNRAILMEVKKEKGFDTIKMVSGIRKLVAGVKDQLPPGVEVVFSNDMSIYLKNRLDVLYSNGLFGAVLVIVMLLLLLRPSVAFWTALGMPVAFAAAYWASHVMGFSLNMMSILGYIMVLGMIVDDGIVVGENVYRHMEEGLPPFEAAVTGAQEMLIPVIASVTTTMAAFSPLILVGGMMGEFLSAIPIVIIIALTASLIECFVVLPSHLSDFVKPKKNLRLEGKQEHWFAVLREKYGVMLQWVLHHRLLFACLIVVLLIVSAVLGFSNGVVFSDAQTQQINISLKADKEYSVDNTEDVVKKIEQQVMRLSAKDLDVVNSYVGMQDDQHGPPRFSPNYAQIMVLLHIEDARQTKDPNKIVNQLREWIGKPEGVKEIDIEAIQGGPPTGAAIDVKITGETYEVLDQVSREFLGAVKNLEVPLPRKERKPDGRQTFKPVADIKTDFEEGKEEIRLMIDEAKASLAGVNLNQAGGLLRAAVAGIKLKTIKKLGENIDLMIRVNEQSIKTLEDLLELRIPNQYGNRIVLGEIVRVERGPSMSTLIHKEGKRAISVIGTIDKARTNVNTVNGEIKKLMEAFRAKYPNIGFDVSGEQEEMMEGFMDLGKAFVVALFLIFIILATLFNSVVQPAIIMLAIPFGFVGVMLTLYVHHMPVSFMAGMGFVGLAGVVVNDSLILVDFIKTRIKNGIPVEEAVVEGAKTRLRPVILTTVTTAVGLFPLAYGWFGGEEPMIKPMALVFSWGLVFATCVTLFIIPCFFVMSMNARIWLRRWFKGEKATPVYFSKSTKRSLPASAPAVMPNAEVSAAKVKKSKTAGRKKIGPEK